MDILIIDIETTGFLNQKGTIVEIGATELNLNTGIRKIVFDKICKEQSFSAEQTIRPFGWIFENSTLTPNDVNNGYAFETIKHELQQLINKYYCTAYNKTFDFGFLKNRGLVIKEIDCLMHLSTNVCKIKGKHSYKWPSVEEAYKMLCDDSNYKEAHRAAKDSYDEAAIAYELFKLGKLKIY
jgi:DNA polymerase-3 subunit epsilon